MTTSATAEEYEADCAARRGETVEEFRRRCRGMGLGPRPCGDSPCDYSRCRGWRPYDTRTEGTQ